MGESMCGLGTPLMASEGAPCRPRPSPAHMGPGACVSRLGSLISGCAPGSGVCPWCNAMRRRNLRDAGVKGHPTSRLGRGRSSRRALGPDATALRPALVFGCGEEVFDRKSTAWRFS